MLDGQRVLYCAAEEQSHKLRATVFLGARSYEESGRL